MPDQSFDLKVFHKINTIIKEHPDNTPFEWFAVGYLWAHLNETLTLDAIFLNVNSVMRLNKLASLSLDDTHEVLIKMGNNLLGPKNNPGSPRKSSVSSTIPSKKGMEVVHETHESEDLIGQKKTKKKSMQVEDSKDNQLSGNLSDNSTKQARKDKKSHDDTSTTKKSTTMNDMFSLDSDEGKKGFKNFDMNKVKQTGRSKTLETVVKDSKSPKSPRSPSFPLEEKSKSVPNQLKRSDVFNDDISSEEENVLKSKKQKSYSRDAKSSKKAEPVVTVAPAKPKATPTFIDDIEEPVANKTPSSSKNPTPSKIVDQIMSTINNKKTNRTEKNEKNDKSEKQKEREFSDDYSYESEEELKPKQDKPVEHKPIEMFEQAQRMEVEEEEDDEESDGKSTSSLIATLGQKKSGNANSNNNTSTNPIVSEKKKEIPKPTWPEEYAVPGIRSNDERDIKSESVPNVDFTAGQDFELYNYYQSQQKNPDICTFGPEEIMDEINVPVNLIESQAQPTLQLENVISIDDDMSSEDLRSAYGAGRTKLTEHYPAPRTVNESVENLEREIEMMRKQMYGDRDKKKPKAMETIDLVEIDSSEGNSPRQSVSVKKITTKENRGGMVEEKTTYVKKAVKDVSFDPWSAGKDLKRLPQKSVEKLAAEKELMQDDDEKELERTKRKEKSRVGGEGSKGNKKKKI